MSKVISLDFTNTQDGFIGINKPGTYPVKIVKVEAKRSDTSGKPYLNWELEVTNGEFKGAKLWYVTSLQPQALFNLRNLLMHAGLDVPKSVVKIDLDSVIGRTLNVVVKMEEYNGEQRPKVKNTLPLSASSTEGSDSDLDLDGIDGVDGIDLEGLDI